MNDCMNIQGLKVNYGSKTVIEDLTVDIPLGKVTTIIGPNGCGKSTLLKAIGRILKPKAGSISVNGEELSSISSRELAKKMAILPQSPISPEGLTVEELASYGRFPHEKKLFGKKDPNNDVVEWALDVTDIKHLRKRVVNRLSGGQRQRVWIAMALAQKTDIILLDEPTTYMDMSYQLDVLLLLQQLNEEYGTTILMVLHDINHASRFSHKIVAMKDGQVMAQGTPAMIMKQDVLRDVFNIQANLVRDKHTMSDLCLSYDRNNLDQEDKKLA